MIIPIQMSSLAIMIHAYRYYEFIISMHESYSLAGPYPLMFRSKPSKPHRRKKVLVLYPDTGIHYYSNMVRKVPPVQLQIDYV